MEYIALTELDDGFVRRREPHRLGELVLVALDPDDAASRQRMGHRVVNWDCARDSTPVALARAGASRIDDERCLAAFHHLFQVVDRYAGHPQLFVEASALRPLDDHDEAETEAHDDGRPPAEVFKSEKDAVNRSMKST